MEVEGVFSASLRPPKLKLAPEVMNYFNEFTIVTRWRLVDYRGLSNLRICIKHERPYTIAATASAFDRDREKPPHAED